MCVEVELGAQTISSLVWKIQMIISFTLLD